MNATPTWPFPQYRINRQGQLVMIRPRKPRPTTPALPPALF